MLIKIRNKPCCLVMKTRRELEYLLCFKELLDYMDADKNRYIFQGLVFGILSTIALNIPLISMFIAIAAFPLLIIFPELSETSEWVEYGPFWLTIRKDEVWFLFIGYFVCIWSMIFISEIKR